MVFALAGIAIRQVDITTRRRIVFMIVRIDILPQSSVCHIKRALRVIPRRLYRSAADSQAVNAQGWLPDTNGDTLPVLATGTDAVIKCHVIADH